MSNAPTNRAVTIRRQDCRLDIWQSTETLRIYPDRTIHRHSVRRYSGSNSWGLGERAERYTGTLHTSLLTILAQEEADGEDYTERLFDVANDTHR